MNRLRALWRLARLFVHGLHCIAVCALLFPFLGPAGRSRRVGWACERGLRCLGIALVQHGHSKPGPVLTVANHISWLDILALNAVRPMRFVSKADVQAWPVLGWIIACGGTLFIERERKRDAMRVLHQVAAALQAGDVLAVFPEGTTNDKRELLSFHANLLQAAVRTGVAVQPVALGYSDRGAARSKAAVWVGETTLAQSLWRIAISEGLTVTVRLLAPMQSPGVGRRDLARRARDCIGSALDEAGM